MTDNKDITPLVAAFVAKMKSGGATPEQIQQAVDAYLEQNPVQPGATVEQVTQIEKNKTDISELSEDIGNVLNQDTFSGKSKDYEIDVPIGSILYFGLDIKDRNESYNFFGYKEDGSFDTLFNDLEMGKLYQVEAKSHYVRIRFNYGPISDKKEGKYILSTESSFNIGYFAVESLEKVNKIDSLKIGEINRVEFPNSNPAFYYPIDIPENETVAIELVSYSGEKLKSITVNAVFKTGGTKTIALGVPLGYVVKFTAEKDIKSLAFIYNLVDNSQEICDKTVNIAVKEDSLIWGIMELKEKTKILKNNFNVVVIGDSYSEQGIWINSLKRKINCNVLNLGVSSASLKDKQTDLNTYPYTDRPTSSKNSGNYNTFMSQVEKLKRLKEGVDLDSGESKYSDIPDIILVQGGTNDGPDQLEPGMQDYTDVLFEKKNVYIKGTDISNTNMYVRKDNLDRTTFIGAVSSIYYELHSLYPNALIMFITPSGLSYTGGNNIDSVKKTFQIKNAAYYVNCPVCEWVDVGFGYYGTLYTGDGTYENPYELSEEYTMANDWLHPNEKFGDILANKVVGELNKYIPIY